MYKFQEIKNAIIHEIESDRLTAFQPLPNIADACKLYHTSEITVGRAYRFLRRNGYIDYQHGKGYFVRSHSGQLLNVLVLIEEGVDNRSAMTERIFGWLAGAANVTTRSYSLDEELGRALTDLAGSYQYFIVIPSNESLEGVLNSPAYRSSEKVLVHDRNRPASSGVDQLCRIILRSGMHHLVKGR